MESYVDLLHVGIYPKVKQSVRRQTGMAKIDFYYNEIEPFVTLVRLYGMKLSF